jgi:hypothetical protein
MKKPSLRLVNSIEDLPTEKDETKCELPENFLEALVWFLMDSEYMVNLETASVENFTLVFTDENGTRIVGDVNDPEILKSRLSSAVWAMNFQQQIGEMYVEE